MGISLENVNKHGLRGVADYNLPEYRGEGDICTGEGEWCVVGTKDYLPLPKLVTHLELVTTSGCGKIEATPESCKKANRRWIMGGVAAVVAGVALATLAILAAVLCTVVPVGLVTVLALAAVVSCWAGCPAVFVGAWGIPAQILTEKHNIVEDIDGARRKLVELRSLVTDRIEIMKRDQAKDNKELAPQQCLDRTVVERRMKARARLLLEAEVQQAKMTILLEKTKLCSQAATGENTAVVAAAS